MAVSVVSQSFYDNQRSKIRLGVTDKGNPYMDMSPIYSAYIGHTNIEEGARVYNQDEAIFVPISTEMNLQLQTIIDLITTSNDEVIKDLVNQELIVPTTNNKRAISFILDESLDVLVSVMLLDNGNPTNVIEHVLPYDSPSNNSNVSVPFSSLLIFKEFLKLSFVSSFSLIYQSAAIPSNQYNQQGSNNGGYTPKNRYSSQGNASRNSFAGTPLRSGGGNMQSNNRIRPNTNVSSRLNSNSNIKKGNLTNNTPTNTQITMEDIEDL